MDLFSAVRNREEISHILINLIKRYNKLELAFSNYAAPVEDTIVDGVLNKAPSQNAVYDALVLKADKSYVDSQDAFVLSSSIAYTDSVNLDLVTNLDQEILDRIAGDTLLSTNLNTEINNRINADSILSTNLSTEISNRLNADIDLQTQISNALSQSVKFIGIIPQTNSTVTGNTALLDSFVFSQVGRVSKNNDQIQDLDNHIWQFDGSIWQDRGVYANVRATTIQEGSVRLAPNITIGELGVPSSDQVATAIANEATLRTNADTILQNNINLKQNILINPITGAITLNTIPKQGTTPGTFVDSIILENGTGLQISGTVSGNPAVASNQFVTKAQLDANVPINNTQIVYVNSTDPNTATIFDLNNPPVTNNNALKTDVNNLYVGTDNSTWVYNSSTSTYVTKAIVNNLLNQIEVSGNQTAQLYWNGKEVTAMTSGLHTIPATLPDQFSYDVASDFGVTVTWAITAPHTWRVAGLAVGVAPPAMTAGQFCTVSKRIGTNEIRVRGLL